MRLASTQQASGHGSGGDPRELEIVRLVAQGLTNREIGRASFISESTVKFHLRNVMEKLGVHRRAEVVHEAGRLGLL